MKKILLSCVTCLLALGLVTACDDEVEEPEEPEVPGTVVDEGGETTYLLGVEVDGVLSYIDGGTVEGYAYEGTLTTDVSKAAAISCESSGSTYYLSFDNSGVTNWVTIAQVVSESDQKTHTNLVYATEKSALYLHTTDGGAEYFGNEDGSYFLCYNSAYKCFYASSITGTPSNSNVPYIQSSPVAGLYTTDGKLVAGGVGEEPAPAIEPVLGTVTPGEYFLGVTMSEANYYFDGTLSGYFGGVSEHGYEAAVVTVAAASDGYTLSFTDSEGATQYLYVYVTDDGYVDLGLQTETFTWQYDTTFETFVVEANNKWNFLGTYGDNQRLGMSDYGYLTGDVSSSYEQYPAQLYDVITYTAPTGITVTVEGETTVEVGGRISLTATITGDDNVDPRLVWDWSSNDSGEVTVSSTGVVLGVAKGSVTVTATSVKDTSISGSIAITVTEASGDVPTTYKLGALDTVEYTYRWFNGSDDGNSSGTHLTTTDKWEEAVDVYITAIDDGIDNTCTLSFYDANGNLKYISAGSSAVTTSIKDDPCTWYWNETYQLFALGTTVGGQSSQDRGLAYYQSSHDIRAYATTSSNITSYSWVNAFTEQPANPEKPVTDVTLAEVSSVVSGQEYYLGALSGDDYQLITGSATNYKLPTTIDINNAAKVIATGNDADGWTLTVNGQYIYAYVYNSNTLELGLSSATTVPSSGVNVFTFDSTSHAFYTSASGAVTSSFAYSYLEYYSGNVCLYGSSSLTFSNAAHLYQVVDN